MMKFFSKDGQTAHFSRIDFLTDRWGAHWPARINQPPFNWSKFNEYVDWCREQGMEFAYKRDKWIYFGKEDDLLLFKLKWI